MDKHLQPLAVGLGDKKSEAIRDALNHVLGVGWSTEDLRTRCALVRFRESPNEVFTIDGKPVIEFAPVELSQRIEGHAIIMQVTQPFRLLYNPNPEVQAV